MVTVDLITGFLGAGKTTFLHYYAAYLLRQGEKIGILENDYGAVNVDVMLLKDLEARGCLLESVAGACDRDCHQRRLKTKLIALCMSGCTRIIVEPSGLFDVEEFFDALWEEPLDRMVRPGSVIAIVDGLCRNLSENSLYLLLTQAASAGSLIFSKTQKTTPQALDELEIQLEEAARRFGCSRQFRGEMVRTPWEQLTDDDWKRISEMGRGSVSFQKRPARSDDYRTEYFLNEGFSREQLLQAAQALIQDPSCGIIHRIKGFFREGDIWIKLNVTPYETELSPVSEGQDVIIVIGERLQKDVIRSRLLHRQEE